MKPIQGNTQRKEYKAGAIVRVIIAMAGLGVLYLGYSEYAKYAIRKAKIHQARQDVLAIEQVLMGCQVDNGHFPTTEQGLSALVQNPGSWNSQPAEGPLDPWGRPYIYRSPGANGSDYVLICTGPSGKEGNTDNIGRSTKP